MGKWIVTTESGSQYGVNTDDGFWMKLGPWESNNRIWAFKSLPADFDGAGGWDALHTLPEASEPVIGERMYLAGRDEWRISMPVAEFRTASDEESV